MIDRVAQMDQAAEDARQTARPIGAFHRSLSEYGIGDELLTSLTMLYAARLIGSSGHSSENRGRS